MKCIIRAVLFYSILVFLIASCSYSRLTVDVYEPAKILIPDRINNLIMLKRISPRDDETRRIVEGVFIDDGLYSTKYGAEQCLTGARDILENSERFDIEILYGLDISRDDTVDMPEPLGWDQVEKLCSDYRADALIVLENFSSNDTLDIDEISRVRVLTRMSDKVGVEMIYPQGNKIAQKSQWASLTVTAKAAWRMYVPAERKIVDEITLTDSVKWEVTDKKRENLTKLLPGLGTAIGYAGYSSGTRYASRISPVWLTVSRYLYFSGNKDVKNTAKLIKQNLWDEAADTWIKYTDSPDNKVAAYVSFNMAVKNEKEGNLTEALEWAVKSLNHLNNTKTQEYLDILNRRYRRRDK